MPSDVASDGLISISILLFTLSESDVAFFISDVAFAFALCERTLKLLCGNCHSKSTIQGYQWLHEKTLKLTFLLRTSTYIKTVKLVI